MNSAEAIEAAVEQLTQLISQEGYEITDHDVEEMPEDAIELYRYPPEEYDQVVCATPRREE